MNTDLDDDYWKYLKCKNKKALYTNFIMQRLYLEIQQGLAGGKSKQLWVHNTTIC